MKAAVSVEQTVQEWGNGLAVRITAPVAKATRLTRGQPIRVEVVEGGVFLRFIGKPKLTLAHQPKSVAWRERGARPHTWKQVPPAVFESASFESTIKLTVNLSIQKDKHSNQSLHTRGCHENRRRQLEPAAQPCAGRNQKNIRRDQTPDHGGGRIAAGSRNEAGD